MDHCDNLVIKTELVCVVFLMARVPEDHMTIHSEFWTGLVLSWSNVYLNCLVHELVDT